MGCHTYTVKTYKRTFYIRFSEGDDEFSCLCTFPHNDNEQFDIERLKSSTLLGAMTALVRNGYFEKSENDYLYIPDDVPVFILDAVRKLMLGK